MWLDSADKSEKLLASWATVFLFNATMLTLNDTAMYEPGTRTEVQSAISLAVAQGPSSLIEMCLNDHLCVFSF